MVLSIAAEYSTIHEFVCMSQDTFQDATSTIALTFESYIGDNCDAVNTREDAPLLPDTVRQGT